MNTAVFKSYDVRGVYGKELFDEDAYLLGRAFANILSDRYALPMDRLRVVVARDARLSSPALSRALIKGITDSGAMVNDIGIVSTDILYFACGAFRFDGGVVITASHNPPQYNGLKFCARFAEGISGETGIFAMRDMILQGAFENGEVAGKKGRIETHAVLDHYISKCLTFIDTPNVLPLTIAVDAGNGVAGMNILKIQESLPVKFIPLFFEPDGEFPNHPSDPTHPENLIDLIQTVKTENADLGIAFDGDGDRAVFIDETGKIVDGAFVLCLLAREFLQRRSGETIVHSSVCSRIVLETVRAYGGVPVVSPVGHSYMKKVMREQGAVFGGESMAGHYYFRDNFFADSGLIAALMIISILSKSGAPFSRLTEPFQKYVRSGQINQAVADPSALIAKISQHYQDGTLADFDGVRIDYPDWWFSLRASNTEPLLRLNVEAVSKELMEQKRDEILKLLGGPYMKNPSKSAFRKGDF